MSLIQTITGLAGSVHTSPVLLPSPASPPVATSPSLPAAVILETGVVYRHGVTGYGALMEWQHTESQHWGESQAEAVGHAMRSLPRGTHARLVQACGTAMAALLLLTSCHSIRHIGIRLTDPGTMPYQRVPPISLSHRIPW
jgi:hypothetical protein